MLLTFTASAKIFPTQHDLYHRARIDKEPLVAIEKALNYC
jgi:hypothetical protein